jgi:hypothetical protein
MYRPGARDSAQARTSHNKAKQAGAHRNPYLHLNQGAPLRKLKEVPMLYTPPEKSAAKALVIPAAAVRDDVRDWLCVAGFVGIAVAVTMAPFILL